MAEIPTQHLSQEIVGDLVFLTTLTRIHHAFQQIQFSHQVYLCSQADIVFERQPLYHHQYR